MMFPAIIPPVVYANGRHSNRLSFQAMMIVQMIAANHSVAAVVTPWTM